MSKKTDQEVLRLKTWILMIYIDACYNGASEHVKNLCANILEQEEWGHVVKQANSFIDLRKVEIVPEGDTR